MNTQQVSIGLPDAEAHPVAESAIDAAAHRASRLRAEIAQLKEEERQAHKLKALQANTAGACSRCSWPWFASAIGVAQDDVLQVEWVRNVNWDTYAERWVNDGMQKAHAALREFCERAEVPFEAIANYAPTQRHEGIVKRIQYTRELFLRLSLSPRNPAVVDGVIREFAVALADDSEWVHAYHMYFEGLAFGVERALRKQPVNAPMAVEQGGTPGMAPSGGVVTRRCGAPNKDAELDEQVRKLLFANPEERPSSKKMADELRRPIPEVQKSRARVLTSDARARRRAAPKHARAR